MYLMKHRKHFIRSLFGDNNFVCQCYLCECIHDNFNELLILCYILYHRDFRERKMIRSIKEITASYGEVVAYFSKRSDAACKGNLKENRMVLSRRQQKLQFLKKYEKLNDPVII